MSDDFTRRKFDWLAQIGGDHTLSSLSVRVALKLVRYFNRETGRAWPSHASIASDTGSTRSGVQRAVNALRDNGHLATEVNRGRHHSNVYQMVIKAPENVATPLHIKEENAAGPLHIEGENVATPLHIAETKCSEPAPENAATPHNKMQRRRCTNPLKDNPLKEETIEGGSLPLPPHSISKKGRRVEKEIETEFETSFWPIYPKRVAREAARAEFIKARRAASLDEITAGLRAYAMTDFGPGNRFAMNAVRWLKEKRWTDEPPPPTGNGVIIDEHGNPVDAPPDRRGQRMSKAEEFKAQNLFAFGLGPKPT